MRKAISPKMRLDVFKEFGAVVLCQLCGNVERIADMDLDHHLPVIFGGVEINNLRPVCHACHAKKSASEHKSNSKAKRLAKAVEIHEKIVAKIEKKVTSRLKSRGFDKTWRKKFNGKAEKR